MLWGVLALVQLEDPWERMPFVFPPYLEHFRATHPGITLTTLNRVSTVRLHAQGQSMQVDGREIADAQVRLERCSQAPSLAALQGLPMPPGARCAAQLTVQRDSETTLRWQYEMDPTTPLDTLRQHFEAWARAEAVDSSSFSGSTHYQFSAEKGAASGGCRSCANAPRQCGWWWRRPETLSQIKAEQGRGAHSTVP